MKCRLKHWMKHWLKHWIATGVALWGLTVVSIPAWAHHSFAAEYDQKAPVQFKGVVSKVDWMNPHVYFYVDVKDQDGKVTHWDCEAGNPNALARRGWKRDSLKAGDEVTVQGFRAKDNSQTMNARSIVLADGRKVFAASSEDGGPTN